MSKQHILKTSEFSLYFSYHLAKLSSWDDTQNYERPPPKLSQVASEEMFTFLTKPTSNRLNAILFFLEWNSEREDKGKGMAPGAHRPVLAIALPFIMLYLGMSFGTGNFSSEKQQKHLLQEPVYDAGRRHHANKKLFCAAREQQSWFLSCACSCTFWRFHFFTVVLCYYLFIF